MIPAAAPLIVTVTPLNSIGRVKLLCSEPTAVCAVIVGVVPDAKLTNVSIPGETPKTADGVCGVGVTEGVGVGVGVAVGLGVGGGVAETESLLAPVAKLKAAADVVVATDNRK